MSIIGNFAEHGRIYIETPDSGIPGRQLVFDPKQLGDMVRERVQMKIECHKRKVKTVIDALELQPTTLYTSGGTNNDGTMADRINWGSNWRLERIDPQPKSPGIATLQLTYVRDRAKAEVYLPSGLTLTYAASTWTLAWKGTTFKTWPGVAGGSGLTFKKGLSRWRRELQQKTASPYTQYYQWAWSRLYYVVDILIDDSPKESAYSRMESLPTDTGVYGQTTNPANVASVPPWSPPPDERTVVESETLGGADYPAQLQWIVDEAANRCRLVWCDSVVWDIQA